MAVNLAVILLLGLLAGCEQRGERVVVYTPVDAPYARPILQEFERRTGIRVIVQVDAEAAKTVGLAERLRAERNNPQADVWWGNEIFYTIDLADDGLFEPYESPSAADIPELFKDRDHLWAGSALRARVMGVSPDSPLAPSRLEDLTDPELRGRIAMARPTAGTTGGHVASLYVLWGEQRTNQFFHDLRENGIRLLGGNSVVADFVGRGTIWAGLTDNDDVAASLREGGRLSQVLPDQDSYGTLVIPCTVALVRGARNPDAARLLIDYLLSPEVEQQLIEMQFAGWSVRELPARGPRPPLPAGERPLEGLRPMLIDYREAARIMPQAIRTATAILEGR